MININLKRLVDTMTAPMRDSLEGAAGLCLLHTHYNVELEHWLLKLLDNPSSDLRYLLEQYDVNPSELTHQLTSVLTTFKTGSSRPAALAPTIVEAAKTAWLLASVDFGHGSMSSGHLLAALLLNETSRRQLTAVCQSFNHIAAESLRDSARAAYGQSSESRSLTVGSDAEEGAMVKASQTPALDQYTVNLTEQAEQGLIDPVLGRDREIRQCIDILTRRRQNNPIMTGEAGVGKTAVVEGFALRIAHKEVPEPLHHVSIRTLDLGLLQAGASIKGEFENRLKSVIKEVKASIQPIILFIDEAHTLIGAGGKEGQGDAANLLKPALARGELRTIAATTWAEYKKYVERDPALSRRFQVVNVDEPREAQAIEMMRAIATSLHTHHGVTILDEAIEASVTLSHRYLPSRQLPDKSVSLLDTACARVALSQSTKPTAIESAERYIQRTDTTMAGLRREQAVMGRHQERIQTLAQEKREAEATLTRLNAQWLEERALIAEMKQVREKIHAAFDASASESAVQSALTKAETSEYQQTLLQLTQQLTQVQGDAPLMQPCVDHQAVAEVIANWTGIPIGKMMRDELQAVQALDKTLSQRVIGQPHAIKAVAEAIQMSRAGLTDPRKPVGVFLFCGTSGVGKTETALALADQLFGGEQNLTTINMSEFKEEHKVSMLLGSPPGYVGYGEGGVLTEAARRKPYSVILLDEMEKAHTGVQDIFYSLLDKGTIKDGEGRDIDFKNTLIIMTSNAGEEAIRAIFEQVDEKPEPQVLLDNIRPYLLQHFKPAFLGRSNVIPFYPLDDENLVEICQINMRRIEKRVISNYGADFTYDEAVLIHIVARCQESDIGARHIEAILNQTLLPKMAALCLERMAQEQPISRVHVGVDEAGEFCVSVD